MLIYNSIIYSSDVIIYYMEGDNKPENERTNPGPGERKHLSLWLNLPSISQKRLQKLIASLEAEGITEPKTNDVIRITRLTPTQAAKYLKAFKAAKKAAAE
jgi:hypothetical protein